MIGHSSVTGMEVATPTKFEDSMILHVAYNNREMCQDEYRWEFYKREMNCGNVAEQTSAAAGSNMAGGSIFGSATLSSPFGQSSTASQPTNAGGLFGSTTATQPANTGGLFGSSSNQTTGFGQAAPSGIGSGGMFGQAQQNAPIFPSQQQMSGQPTAGQTINILGNIPKPQAIPLDRNHALGALVESVDFDSIGAGLIQFWTNTKTEHSINEQIANEPSITVSTFTSPNTSSPYLSNLPDFENRFDPYNLEPILKQIGKPNKIYHLMNINEMKPTLSIDYSTVHGQEFSSMFHIGESKYVPGKQIQNVTQNFMSNVFTKFWEKSLGATIDDLQDIKTHELSSGALLFTNQSNRNPFKTNQFMQVEIKAEEDTEFDQKDVTPNEGVQHFSLDRSDSIQNLTDKLLSKLNDLQLASVNQLNLVSPTQCSKFCAPKLTKQDYYTVPSIESLSLMTEEQLAAVMDLTIKHEKFGEVLWPGFTDVREMDFDKIVNFSYKSLSIYQDMSGCIPPVGHGLNKTAIITLYKCVPVGNFTEEKNREIIRNMEAYTKSINCEFISASTETGNWRFKSVAEKYEWSAM